MADLLKFQIQHITSRRLQRELFEAFAPALKVDWEGLPQVEKERAAALAAAVCAFSNLDRRQHDHLCAALGVIGIIGNDSKNTTFLEEEIKKEQLHDQYVWDDFGLRKKAKTTNNITAWICVLAHRKCADEAEEKRQSRAKLIWGRLCNMASALSADSGSYVFFLTPTTREGLSNEERCAAFREDYVEYRSQVTGIRDYPAVADVSPHFEFTRYSVNMAPNPHLSVQLEGSDFDSKIDPNADSFRIDHYADRGYLRMTRVDDKATSQHIAAIFAESALGAKIESMKGRRHSLAAFSDRGVVKQIGEALPEANRTAKDEVWVSALRCRYLDSAGQQLSKNHEYDFPYDPSRDIYQNLELGYPLARDGKMPLASEMKVGVYAAKRELLEVEISFHLHERVPIGGGRKGFSDRFAPVVKIKTTPKSCDYRSKTKDICAEHRELIYDVLKRCDLLEKTRNQIILGDA